MMLTVVVPERNWVKMRQMKLMMTLREAPERFLRLFRWLATLSLRFVFWWVGWSGECFGCLLDFLGKVDNLIILFNN